MCRGAAKGGHGASPKISKNFAINVHIGRPRPADQWFIIGLNSGRVPKMVARCTLFNITTVKTVFSLSMMVTNQTAEKNCEKFTINVRLKIINIFVIALRKINRSNFLTSDSIQP